MGDPFRTVRVGERFDSVDPSAAFRNDTLRAINAVKTGRIGYGKPPRPRRWPGVHVDIKAQTSAAGTARFACLGVDNPELNATNYPNTFKQQTTLSVSLPTWADHWGGRFVIAQSKMPDTGTGRALAAGITWVQVVTHADWHEYADINPNNATMDSCASGPAEIIWKEASGSTRWAIIRFPVTPPPAYFELKDDLDPADTNVQAYQRYLSAADTWTLDTTNTPIRVDDVRGQFRGAGYDTGTRERGHRGTCRRLPRSSRWEILDIEPTPQRIQFQCDGAVSGGATISINNIVAILDPYVDADNPVWMTDDNGEPTSCTNPMAYHANSGADGIAVLAGGATNYWVCHSIEDNRMHAP